MFSAFFGHYLLNKGIVSGKQLSLVLEKQKEVRLKLGTLAINDGFMNSLQVEEVHALQAAMDKRFGEIAIEKEFLNEAQLMHLLKQQKSEHLLLAQALIDENIMTMAEFEDNIKGYKLEHSLSDDQFEELKTGNVDLAIHAFLAFEKDDKNKYDQYISLFMKNLIRFIDVNVSVDRVTKVNSMTIAHAFKQKIKEGDTTYITLITGEEDVLMRFASAFVDEPILEIGEYLIDAIGEFMNLHNGLFVVNRSNDGVEMELTVQAYAEELTIKSEWNLYSVPIYTSFGTIKLIIGQI